MPKPFESRLSLLVGLTDHDMQRLPPAITVPFLQISSSLELPPIATYAAVQLWNFVNANGSFDLDSLRVMHSFTGTESESWFFMVSVSMERQAARIVPTMLHAIQAVKTRELEVITSALQKLTSCIEEVGRLLERMHEKCDPWVFYNEIRPFLAGTKNMAGAGLPRGVFYDEGDGEGAMVAAQGWEQWAELYHTILRHCPWSQPLFDRKQHTRGACGRQCSTEELSRRGARLHAWPTPPIPRVRFADG